MNRLRGNGPSGFGGGRAWPVVVVPACLAVRRSYTPERNTPSPIRSTRDRGTPSKSNGRPSVPSDRASSELVTIGAGTCCPGLPEKHHRPPARPAAAAPPSRTPPPPTPTHARNPTSVETAAGSRTTVYRPGSTSRGDREANALSAGRQADDAGC